MHEIVLSSTAPRPMFCQSPSSTYDFGLKSHIIDEAASLPNVALMYHRPIAQ